MRIQSQRETFGYRTAGEGWKRDSYGSSRGNPRAEGQFRVTRASDGNVYQLHQHFLEGYGDDVNRRSEHLGDHGSEAEAQAAADQL